MGYTLRFTYLWCIRRCQTQSMVLFRNENLYSQIRNIPFIEILKISPLRFSLTFTFLGKHSLVFQETSFTSSFWAPRAWVQRPYWRSPGDLQACCPQPQTLGFSNRFHVSLIFVLEYRSWFWHLSSVCKMSNLKQMFIKLKGINAYWFDLLFNCFMWISKSIFRMQNVGR